MPHLPNSAVILLALSKEGSEVSRAFAVASVAAASLFRRAPCFCVKRWDTQPKDPSSISPPTPRPPSTVVGARYVVPSAHAWRDVRRLTGIKG
jgi:hypothetical protein